MAHGSTANEHKHTVRLLYAQWAQEEQSTARIVCLYDILTVCIDWKRQ